jgi:hypothetical protein
VYFNVSGAEVLHLEGAYPRKVIGDTGSMYSISRTKANSLVTILLYYPEILYLHKGGNRNT